MTRDARTQSPTCLTMAVGELRRREELRGR